MMTKAQKAEEIAQLSENFKKAKAAFLVDFKGLSVEKVTAFRKKLGPLNAQMKVVRNTLAVQALKDHPGYQGALSDDLSGCNALIFAYDDVSAPAKSLKDFAEEAEELVIKGGAMDGKKLGEEQIKYLATLPGKDVLRAMLLGTLQAPMGNFLRVLNGVPSGFVRVLNGRKTALEQQG